MFSSTRGRLCSQSWRVHSCGLQISKTTSLVQRFQVSWRAFCAFDTVPRLCESKTGLVFQAWTNKNPVSSFRHLRIHWNAWIVYRPPESAALSEGNACVFIVSLVVFMSRSKILLPPDNAAKWNAPEIILDVCRSLYHSITETFKQCGDMLFASQTYFYFEIARCQRYARIVFVENCSRQTMHSQLVAAVLVGCFQTGDGEQTQSNESCR